MLRGARVSCKHGAFAVFGQLVMMRGSQTGLLKQNNGSQEGKRMRERISGAEHGLQAVPERSNKNSWYSTGPALGGSAGTRSDAALRGIGSKWHKTAVRYPYVFNPTSRGPSRSRSERRSCNGKEREAAPRTARKKTAPSSPLQRGMVDLKSRKARALLGFVGAAEV